MAHPYASQAQSSQKARLKRLGATAGKAHGSSSMYKKHAYPGGAGTQREYTISGGSASGKSAKSRPDRMAAGGIVGKKRRPHATTNIIISHAGGRGGMGGGGGAGGQPQGPVPVPVPRPVPVPVGAGPGPMGPGGPAPVRPPIAGGPMPAGPGPVPVRPPMGPMGPPPVPVRPPGMKAGGSVKKRGGFLKDSSGKGYPGYPHSPTSESGDKVSAHKAGGGVKKLQFGGGSGLGSGAAPGTAQGQGLVGLLGSVAPGRAPMPAQRGTPTISGVDQVPAQPLTVPQPKLASSFLQRPAPGTTTTYRKGGAVHRADGGDVEPMPRVPPKERTAPMPQIPPKEKGLKRGGAVHDDEAQDRKLFGKMMKERKRAAGGIVKTPVTNASGGGAGGKARLKKTSAAKSAPGQTGSPSPGFNPAPRGMKGASTYRSWGKGET